MINSLEFIEDSELSIHSIFFPAVLPLGVVEQSWKRLQQMNPETPLET